ncbi:MAG: arsenic resistance N-acetyltransferase ArsN2 [Pseudomonadota bacterium]
MSIQPLDIGPQAMQLLAGNHLPTDDLHAPPNTLRLFGHWQGDCLTGLVGLELQGPAMLLRSLVVAESARGQGLGARLVEHAEHCAAAQGARALYLLTTSAEAFFAQRGYQLAERATAPGAITATRQFAGLCPAAAAFMVKRLI